MYKRSPVRPIRGRFVPWPDALAIDGAARAKEYWAFRQRDGQLNSGMTQCIACQSPERERIDQTLLRGSVRAAARLINSDTRVVTNHRDRHLLPMLGMMRFELDLGHEFPFEGSIREQIQFFEIQWFALRQLLIHSRTGSLELNERLVGPAIRCLENMQKMTLEAADREAAAPLKPAELDLNPEVQRRIEDAYGRSREPEHAKEEIPT